MSDRTMGYSTVNLTALLEYNISRSIEIVTGRPTSISAGKRNLETSLLHLSSFVLTKII